jgi:iron(III) transport system ATP-binding protein
MPILSLQGITKRFAPDRPAAVDDLSLTLEQGEILALVGPSGSGKTTTLRLIAGFEVPDQGLVVIRGETMAGPNRWLPPEERGVGVVFQDYALFPHLTVEENVAFGLHRLDRPARRRRTAEILELVGLDGFGSRYPHELSSGQQQRVAAARALAPAPALILLDEPFSSLDADLKVQIRKDVEKILRNTGTTAIIVTHDQELAFILADRVGVMNSGRLEHLDPPEEIYQHPPSRFVAEFVEPVNFLPGLVTADGIVTELGVFENVDGRPVGEIVKVMIRPDDVSFTLRPDGESTIVHHHLRGPEILYCIRLPSGRRVHSSQCSPTVYAMGSRVRAEAHLIHPVTLTSARRLRGFKGVPGRSPRDPRRHLPRWTLGSWTRT